MSTVAVRPQGATPVRSPNRHAPRRNRASHLKADANGELTRSLDRALEGLTCYESESDDVARGAALDYLEKVLARWTMTLRTIDNTVQNNNKNASTSNNPWQRPRVALVSFGSYRLGVHRSDSDLDVLAVAPPACTRHDFFTSLVQLLRQDTANVRDVHPIPGAYTPVIKFILRGYAVDMLFANVADATKLLDYQRKRVSPLVGGPGSNSSRAREDYVIDDTDLLHLDQAGVRSVNGARVSQILLSSVPNLVNFRAVLKGVKEWAIQAGIYSNVLGFLGGVNWAILVAHVCRQHPEASRAGLLESFFRTYANWKWPRPVLLLPIQDKPPTDVLPMPAWNPDTNPRDGLHIMPIITPAYPSMNSSYNVGMPQLRRIQDEFILACNHLKKNRGDYAGLFRPSNFFARHEHFIQVTVTASNRQDFVEWFRLVQSRLRLLLVQLETPQVHAWPFCHFYDCQYDAAGTYLGPGKTSDPAARHESLFFVALRFAPELENVNLQHQTTDFLHNVNSWEQRKPTMDLRLAHVTQADLPACCGVPIARTAPPDLASPYKKCRVSQNKSADDNSGTADNKVLSKE